MADTRTPVRGRSILRCSAQTSPKTSPAASPAKYARAFMLRVARRIADRAAQKRRNVAEYSADAEAKRMARLAPAAEFMAVVIASIPVGSHPHAALVSPLHDGSLDQALQALRAADPRQAVKMLNMAIGQADDLLDRAEARRIVDSIRVTRLVMSNPDRLPTLRAVGTVRDLAGLVAELLSDFHPAHFPDLQGDDVTEWAVAA